MRCQSPCQMICYVRKWLSIWGEGGAHWKWLFFENKRNVDFQNFPCWVWRWSFTGTLPLVCGTVSMTFCLHDLHCTCLQQVVLLLYINNSSILRYIFIINSSSFLSARLFNLALEALLIIIVFVLAQLRSRPRPPWYPYSVLPPIWPWRFIRFGCSLKCWMWCPFISPRLPCWPSKTRCIWLTSE